MDTDDDTLRRSDYESGDMVSMGKIGAYHVDIKAILSMYTLD